MPKLPHTVPLFAKYAWLSSGNVSRNDSCCYGLDEGAVQL